MQVDVKGTGLLPGLGGSLEEDVATHSSIVAWRIPWTEETARLQSTGSYRVGYNRSDLAHMHLELTGLVTLKLTYDSGSKVLL